MKTYDLYLKLTKEQIQFIKDLEDFSHAYLLELHRKVCEEHDRFKRYAIEREWDIRHANWKIALRLTTNSLKERVAKVKSS